MSQPENDTLQQAQDYIRTGQLPQAQRLLVAYIKKNPNSEEAWYLLSTAVDDPRKQIECLQRVLRINPGNTAAQSRLMKTMGTPTPPAMVETPPPPAPAIEPEPVASFSPIVPLTSSTEKYTTATTVAAVIPPAETPVTETTSASFTDTELSSLRSNMKFVNPKAPRRRGVRIILLLLLILVALLGGSYLMIRSLMPPPLPLAGTSAESAAAAVPSATLRPTNTPTSTPIPSFTPTRFPPTWTPTPTATALPTRTPTPLPPLAPDVETTLRIIRDQISTVRALSYESDVPVALLSPDSLEPALRSILNIQSLQARLQNQSRVLAAFKLVNPSTDLTQYVYNSFADNLGGFYVPWQNVMYVSGQKFGTLERQAYTLEAARALADQIYRADKTGLNPLCEIEGQGCQAVRALLAGDAALATDQRNAKYATAAEKKELAKYQPPAQIVPDESASLFMTRDVAFAAEQGRKFANALYQSGGWKALNAALENPPDSTEKILHPEKYLAGEQTITVTAVPLTSTLGAPWTLIASDSLGEWRTNLLLSAGVDEAARLSDATAQQAAAGWGGDHYEVYLNPQTGDIALATQWVWDTPQDTAEFKQAMIAYLDLRFRGANVQTTDQDCWAANGQTTCLYSSTDQNAVLWVLAPDLATVEKIHTTYAGF